jgi:hypothetical protein
MSFTHQLRNLSFAEAYTRLTSVANIVSSQYTTANLN